MLTKEQGADLIHAVTIGRLFAHVESLLAAEREAVIEECAMANVLTASVRDVLTERQRQIEREGWTPEHDDAHDSGEMARAAVSYILQTILFSKRSDYQAVGHLRMWPWDSKWWKPKDPRRDLVRAAALILAEIDRLDRAAIRALKGGK